MHSKTLKRKAADDKEIADFIAQWSPIHCPNFFPILISRPNKARRTNKALALAGKADFYVPDAPPNSPNPPIISPVAAKGKARAPLDDDNFQPSPIQKSWIKKSPFLEAKYRRNDQLKNDFADTSVPLKAALIEIGKRTMKKLNEEENWHKEGDNMLNHYVLVQDLEKRMKGKVECIDTRTKVDMTLNENRYEYDKAVIEGEFQVGADSSPMPDRDS